MVWECIKMAYSSLLAHKLRSLLTMLGIMIGVGSVITIVSLGQSGDAALKKQFAGSKNNTLEIMHMNTDAVVGTAASASAAISPFTEADVFELERIESIVKVTPTSSAMSSVTAGDTIKQMQIIGVSEQFEELQSIEIVAGRTMTNNELRGGLKAALISEEAARSFGQEKNPVGEIIEIEGIPFFIIGMFASKQNGLAELSKESLLVPQTVWPSLFGNGDYQSLIIQVSDLSLLEETGQKALDYFTQKAVSTGLPGEYYVLNMEQIKEALSSITTIMTAIIGGIAAISLFIGGIGVMNIMLVSVTERTREIGIRKALGATRGMVLAQFLTESAALTTIGGMIGVGLGLGGAYTVAMISNMPPVVSWQVILLGVLFSMSIGIFFGLLPAYQAAKWEPVDSLRYE
ncbi:ABC transporter permease [Paenibacillus woosongensis]|uniref:ABC transporter permease n=1 Tax=Paenibacillus woosongensis TaxID=307580 RepID=A0ABQ4MSW0_9BACL|nr:ABC transporter permease [Paenibacillus woosongensis]GIP59004.1 ABC transporter permease [Paenibacillus woosongensis]